MNFSLMKSKKSDFRAVGAEVLIKKSKSWTMKSSRFFHRFMAERRQAATRTCKNGSGILNAKPDTWKSLVWTIVRKHHRITSPEEVNLPVHWGVVPNAINSCSFRHLFSSPSRIRLKTFWFSFSGLFILCVRFTLGEIECLGVKGDKKMEMEEIGLDA